jgi:hypothetical protein
MQNPGSDAGVFVCLDRKPIANYWIVIPGRALRASPESITTMGAMAYYVYLLASKKDATLYLGVANNLVRRGYEHRTKAAGGFLHDTASTSSSGSKSMLT